MHYLASAVNCASLWYFQALQHDILVEAERVSSVLVRGRHLLDDALLVSDDVATTIELVDSVDRRWASLRQSASDVSARLKQVWSGIKLIGTIGNNSAIYFNCAKNCISILIHSHCFQQHNLGSCCHDDSHTSLS